MITPEEVETTLIDGLAEVYPKPARSRAFAERIADATPEWVTPDQLQDLAKRIVTTRDAKTFPNIPTLLTLVKAIPREATGDGGPKVSPRIVKRERIGGIDHEFRHGQEGAKRREDAYAEAEKRCYRILSRSELARRAVSEKWAVGLVDFVIREGREPGLDEEEIIIARVRANDVDVRDLVSQPDKTPRRRNAPQPIAAGLPDALRRMRAAMHEASARRITEIPEALRRT